MRLNRFCAALVAALFCVAASAAPIEANGTAPMDAGATAAREMAIQDALRQAALSQGAQVDSAQYMNSGQVSESTSLSAAPISGKVRVLEEHEEGGLYQVRVSIDPDPATAHTAAGCRSPVGRALRRRVVAAYFYIDHEADASDLDALGVRLAHDVARRLAQRSNEFAARDAGNIGVLPDSHLTEPDLAASAVRQLAASTNSQFVVTGRVLSAAVTNRGPRLTFFGSTISSQQGLFFNGPPAALFGPGLIYRSTAREFQLELWIYDGLTGSLLRTQQFSTIATGYVQPKTPLVYGTEAFWQTDYGEEINTLMDNVTNEVASTLSCIPFSARVLRVAGDQLFLDAGGLDGLQVGDKLLVYRQRLSNAVIDPQSGRELGVPETLLGDVSLIQVQPNLSVAVAHGARAAVQAGDLLRFVPRR
ncbi:MAG: flagellar assembly protein T N-terminal domain-containing protein [Paludibacterium sp.]|uniref:flagellar assembly protein T N-terminal domain-containing protein n=1 Tax=Paludibacterium sp. TaxID=1917523 RepID=UPI0025D4DCF4|nr:flagellar assembly protein T N-terminal domain-containing protein [Paludibacterium sp.]MBV8049467.1 flagellar assembly protein T N-terminal domain-containing protein [Paludibacterium sp.]MBV8648725.1 flagellar assembly protein T N-terminal domain-containing protein [Paludibacterium sp.]